MATLREDMQFSYELYDSRFTLYERTIVNTKAQNDCKGVLSALGQTLFSGPSSSRNLEIAIIEVFGKLEFEPKPDVFSLTRIGTPELWFGTYHPVEKRITDFKQHLI